MQGRSPASLWSVLSDVRARGGAACVFCSGPVDAVTYLWPEWLCSYFARLVTSWHADGDVNDAFVERLGNAVDQTVDCVCQSCTNGWIERLDEDVVEFLLALIAGDQTALSRTQQRALAVWVAKTAAVVECLGSNRPPTSRWAYECLRRREIRTGTQVLIGRYNGSARLLDHTSENLPYRLGNTERHVPRSTFVIGELFMQVCVDPWHIHTARSAKDDRHRLIALVPYRRRKIYWPPADSIDDALCERARRGDLLEEPRDVRNDPRSDARSITV